MALSGGSTALRSIKVGLLVLLPRVGGLLGWYSFRSFFRASSLPLPFYSSEDFTAEWIEPTDPRSARIHRIAPFSLRNQSGELVTNASLHGKVYVANFFFTGCPGICPKMATNLLRIQTAFSTDDDVVLVSHSVMPDKDSEKMLRTYASDHGVVSESGTCLLVTRSRSTHWRGVRTLRKSSPDLSRTAASFCTPKTCCSLTATAESVGSTTRPSRWMPIRRLRTFVCSSASDEKIRGSPHRSVACGCSPTFIRRDPHRAGPRITKAEQVPTAAHCTPDDEAACLHHKFATFPPAWL